MFQWYILPFLWCELLRVVPLQNEKTNTKFWVLTKMSKNDKVGTILSARVWHTQHLTYFFFWNGTWFFQSLCCFGRHRWLDNTSSITNKLILAILMFFGLNFFCQNVCFFVDTCLQTLHGPLSWIINEYSLDPWLDQNNRLIIRDKWTAQFFFGFSDLLSGVVQHKPHCNKHKLKVI